jgi:hypothetical protein
MKRLLRFVPVALVSSFLVIYLVFPAASALANTYTLEAQAYDHQVWTDFSLVWHDNNLDGLFQPGEEEPGSFTGVTNFDFMYSFTHYEG